LQLIDEFVEEQNRSNTKKAYKGYTKKFKAFLQENDIIFDKNYVKTLRKYDIDDDDDLNNKYEVLRKFYKYLQDNYSTLDAKTKNYHKYCIVALFNRLGIEINSKTLDKKLTNKDEVVARDSEEGFDKEFVIKFLQHCDDTRLKTWVLFMATTGWRPVESLTLRWADLLDWENEDKKTRAYLHGDYTKTRRDRKRYITDELSEQLRRWKHEKYADKYTTEETGNGKRKGVIDNKLKYNKRDLIFAKRKRNINPTTKVEMIRKTQSLYDTLLKKFFSVRKKLKIEELNENNGRNLFTPKSLRHYVKTEVSWVTKDSEYSEYFIGHHVNYKDKGGQREIDNFVNVEKALTFLDPNILISYGKTDSKKLEELERKSKQIDYLTEQVKQQKKEMLLMKFNNFIDRLMEIYRENQSAQAKKIADQHNGKLDRSIPALIIEPNKQLEYFLQSNEGKRLTDNEIDLIKAMINDGEIKKQSIFPIDPDDYNKSEDQIKYEQENVLLDDTGLSFLRL
jgi:integrase